MTDVPWRGATGLLTALLLAWTGCSSVRQIPAAQLAPADYGEGRVVMRDGYTYDFARVAVEGDSLVGTYLVVEERIGEGEIAYVDVARQTHLPLGRIAHLELRRVDMSKTLLVGAGGVLTALWLATLFDSEESAAEDDGKINPLEQGR